MVPVPVHRSATVPIREGAPLWLAAIVALALTAGASAGGWTVPELIGRLDHDNGDVRLSTCEMLGDRGPAAADAVEALIARLDDPHCRRRLAGCALREECVGDAAAEALGAIGPAAAAAVPALERVITSGEAGDRSAGTAMVAIARIAGPAALLEWAEEGRLEEVVRSLDVAFTRHEVADRRGLEALVPRLPPLFAHRDPTLRRAAFAVTTALGPAALPIAAEVIADVGQINHPDAGQTEALIAMGDGVVARVRPLLDSRHHTSRRVARAVIEALAPDLLDPIGPLGETPREAVAELVRILEDTADGSNRFLREAAVLRLREYGADAAPAIDGLAEDLVGTDAAMVAEVILTLGAIGEAAVVEVAAGLAATFELRDAQPDLAFVPAEFTRLQRRLIAVLGASGLEAALPPLVGVLARAEDELRIAACTAIGRLGPAGAGAADDLRTIVDGSGDRDLRNAALTSLAAVAPGPDTSRRLVEAVEVDDALRSAAIRALIEAGPEVAGTVADLLRSPSVEARRWACTILARIGRVPEAAVLDLVGLLTAEDRAVAEAASGAVGSLVLADPERTVQVLAATEGETRAAVERAIVSRGVSRDLETAAGRHGSAMVELVADLRERAARRPIRIP